MEDQNDREKRYPGLPIEREEDRNRLYFVADTAEKRSASLRDGKTEERSADPQPGSHRELSDRTARRCPARLLADTEGRGRGECGNEAQPRSGGHADGAGIVGNVVKPGLEGCIGPFDMELQGRTGEDGSTRQTGPCNGFWSDAVWLPCRDGKARPTQPGIFPLAYGAAARVGRLRGYGNAICAPVAEEFIRAYMEVSHD